MKEIVKSNLKPNEYTTFAFTKQEYDNLDFEDAGKEFNYKGKMYDVIRTFKSYNKIIVHCINDDIEEKLVDNFIQTVNKLKTEHTPLKNFRLGFVPIFPIIKSFFCLPKYFNKLIKEFSIEINFSISFFPETDTPPPKFLI